MLKKALPSFIRKSVYGPEPGQRAAELPWIGGLEIRKLFPDVPEEIYIEGGDVSVIRKSTEEALKKRHHRLLQPRGASTSTYCGHNAF